MAAGPTATVSNISLTTNEDTPVTINITAAVRSSAGSALEVSMGAPNNGVIAVATANQAWVSTPKADWFGVDSFQYNVTASGVTVTALVTITVVSMPGEEPAADPGPRSYSSLLMLVVLNQT
jgi:hypothetical protein